MWHAVLDCAVIRAVDMQFELIWRRGGGEVDGGTGTDTPIATWTHHFDPKPGDFTATPYSEDVAGTAVDFASGDQLVFRYTDTAPTATTDWEPNGEGESGGGEDPNFTLPK